MAFLETIFRMSQKWLLRRQRFGGSFLFFPQSILIESASGLAYLRPPGPVGFSHSLPQPLFAVRDLSIAHHRSKCGTMRSIIKQNNSKHRWPPLNTRSSSSSGIARWACGTFWEKATKDEIGWIRVSASKGKGMFSDWVKLLDATLCTEHIFTLWIKMIHLRAVAHITFKIINNDCFLIRRMCVCEKARWHYRLNGDNFHPNSLLALVITVVLCVCRKQNQVKLFPTIICWLIKNTL